MKSPTRQNPKMLAPAVATLCALGLALTGCATADRAGKDVSATANQLKSDMVSPAPDAGFIPHPERQTEHAGIPFQKVWIKTGFDKSAYKAIAIAPVDTRYMLEMDWLHKLSSANWVSDVQADIKELAAYFHDQVVKEFKEDPKHRFQVIEHGGKPTQPALRLELALIEIDPSQPVLHALSWAGPPGSGTAAGAINQRRAAFEGRLRDMQTGEVVATFADRDMADMGPLDLTRLTWYGPAKGIMDRWAKQFVQVANRKPGEVVTDPLPFTLRPF